MKSKYLLLIYLFLAGCYLNESSLHGSWQAVGFYENGQRMPVALDSVSLVFTHDGTYLFSSVGHYSESGLYRTSMHYLLMTDTTVEPARDHILKVLYLSKDSLKLQMEQNGNDQVLMLVRTD